MKINETLSQKLTTVLSVFSLNILWLFVAIKLIDASYKTIPLQVYITTETAFGAFFFSVIFAPLWEEAVFRYFPLSIIKYTGQDKLILPVVIATSCIFGVLHGGVEHILIQGVAGLSLSYVYIKNGWDYKWSVLYHALWNFSLIYVLPVIVH